MSKVSHLVFATVSTACLSSQAFAAKAHCYASWINGDPVEYAEFELNDTDTTKQLESHGHWVYASLHPAGLIDIAAGALGEDGTRQWYPQSNARQSLTDTSAFKVNFLSGSLNYVELTCIPAN